MSGLNVALTLATLAAATIAILSLVGGDVLILDALSNLALVYGAVGLLGFAWSLAAGRGPVVVFSIMAMALSAGMVLPQLEGGRAPMAPATTSGQLKIIQINAQRGNRDVNRLARWLISERPDIITVTEARHDLRDLMRRQGWKVAGGAGDLMIFTRAHYLVMNRPRLGHDAEVNFVNATYASESGPLEVVSAHLGWPVLSPTPLGLRDLRPVVRTLRGERTILTGDLNAAPWSAELRGLERAIGLIRRDDVIPTWPAKVAGIRWPLPFLPIDHVYAGPAWATVSVRRGPFVGSDHYPLIVVLAPVPR